MYGCMYIPARGKVSVHPRWYRKEKRIELSPRIKTPLVHPESSSQKNKNIQKILDTVTSKSITQKWEKHKKRKKNTNLWAQLQEKYQVKTSRGLKKVSLSKEKRNKVKAKGLDRWDSPETGKWQNSKATNTTAKCKPRHSNCKSRQQQKKSKRLEKSHYRSNLFGSWCLKTKLQASQGCLLTDYAPVYPAGTPDDQNDCMLKTWWEKRSKPPRQSPIQTPAKGGKITKKKGEQFKRQKML